MLLSEERWDEVERKFKELGFNRVHPPGTSPTKAIQDLIEDISLRRRIKSDKK